MSRRILLGRQRYPFTNNPFDADVSMTKETFERIIHQFTGDKSANVTFIPNKELPQFRRSIIKILNQESEDGNLDLEYALFVIGQAQFSSDGIKVIAPYER